MLAQIDTIERGWLYAVIAGLLFMAGNAAAARVSAQGLTCPPRPAADGLLVHPVRRRPAGICT